MIAENKNPSEKGEVVDTKNFVVECVSNGLLFYMGDKIDVSEFQALFADFVQGDKWRGRAISQRIAVAKDPASGFYINIGIVFTGLGRHPKDPAPDREYRIGLVFVCFDGNSTMNPLYLHPTPISPNIGRDEMKKVIFEMVGRIADNPDVMDEVACRFMIESAKAHSTMTGFGGTNGTMGEA